MCSNYPTAMACRPWSMLPPHPDWVKPDGSLRPVLDLKPEPEERPPPLWPTRIGSTTIFAPSYEDEKIIVSPLAKVAFIEAGKIKTDTVPHLEHEPADTYHDDMRRFFCGLLVALPIAGVVWGVLVVAIILGVAKTAGHN